MDKTKQNKRFLILTVKILLFGILLWFIYRQLAHSQQKGMMWPDQLYWWPVALVLLLMLMQWWLEFRKWELSLRAIQLQTPLGIRFRSFASGIVTGFMTPNLLGNFIGRIFYFDAQHRPALIALTLFSNAGQFLSSMLFGFAAVQICGLPKDLHWLDTPIARIGFIVFLLISMLLYLFLKRIPRWLHRFSWVHRFEMGMQASILLRIKWLIYSALRHFIFSTQYVLLLYAFGLEFKPIWLLLIWQVYFWSTMVPSLWFGKLLIRESVALWIFVAWGAPAGIVLISSVSLWLINQGISALIGLPFVEFQKPEA